MTRIEEIVKKIWSLSEDYSQELDDEFVTALAEELESEFYPEDEEYYDDED